jgi:hypothetical protein
MVKKPDPKLLELEKKQEKRIEDLKKYPRKQQHVHEQKFKLGQKKMEEAARDDYTSSPPSPAVTFERPQEGKIEKRIGGMDTFHVEKGEEKNTYKITTKRELTFQYMIRAKSEEDAMIRTLRFVSKDGSGQREDVKRPMYASKPIIREWIESIMKIS